ncbi:MAG: hypothetical protein ABL859_06135 [Methylotenera sp.]
MNSVSPLDESTPQGLSMRTIEKAKPAASCHSLKTSHSISPMHGYVLAAERLSALTTGTFSTKV